MVISDVGEAMKRGNRFLTKPFRDQEILDAVALALDRDRKRRDEEKAVQVSRPRSSP